MRRADEQRVVVTGLGAVTPVGAGFAATWEALVAGRSGVGPLTLVDPDGLAVRIAGEVDGFDPAAVLGVRAARHVDRFAAFAVAAAREAVAHARLDVAADPERVGVVIATGLGGVASHEAGVATVLGRGPSRVSPFLTPAMIGNAAAAAVGMDTGARGPSLCPVTACAAGTDAVGLAADMIRLGRADAVLAGGADAPLTRTVLAGFATMRAASTRNDDPPGASRPFAAGRDGFVAAEGAAVLVLESLAAARARGAVPLAEVTGYGAASDAHHMTAPRPDGAGAVAAMRRALADAGVTPGDVGYVNAHGTSTPRNDEVEARALHAVFTVPPPVSSTKSMTGHLMGASGALEAAVCVQVLRTGVLPPTRNGGQLQPGIDLDVVPDRARRTDGIEVVLSNGFGFGGHDACLVLRRMPPAG